MKYSIIIPCYNEGENVSNLISLLEKTGKGYDIQWIMVENGSRDNTRAELEKWCKEKPQFTIAYVDHNQGYGYGLQQGITMSKGDYIGWLHADMQILPSEMMKFLEIAEVHPETKYFFKGRRKNRKLLDCFFTGCMTEYASIVLGTWIYDIGAIPVLFHKDLLPILTQLPYDFAIETYVYTKAKQMKLNVKRYDVIQQSRTKGKSSWNNGIRSKIRQSKIIMKDIINIRKGIQVK